MGEIAKSKRRGDPLLQLIATLQERWQLQDWEIALRRGPGEKTPCGQQMAQGSVRHSPCTRSALVVLPSDYDVAESGLEMSEPFVVAHEMAHLLLSPFLPVMESALRWAPEAVREVLAAQWQDAEELICNILAADATGERPKPYWGEQA